MNVTTSEQSYWQNHLKGVFSSDAFPPTKRRPGASAFLRQDYPVALDRCGIESGMLSLPNPEFGWLALIVTALNLLQHRISGDRATCVGCLLNTRSRLRGAGHAQLTPVVARFSADRTCAELMRDAFTILNEVASHGGPPIAEVLTWTGHACSLAPSAAFQSIVVVENLGDAHAGMPGCTTDQLADWRAELLERDIVVYAHATDRKLNLRFEYDQELWVEDDIQRLGRDFTKVLNGLANGPTILAERLLADVCFDSYPELGTRRLHNLAGAHFDRRQIRIVESALRKMSAVEDAAILEAEDEDGAAMIYAFVVSSTPPTLEGVRRYLAQRCPLFLMPARLVHVDRIPRNGSDEVDESSLRAAGTHQAAHARTMSQAERYLVRLWSEVLRLDEISVDGHFIELGGHSVLATQVVSRIHRDLGLSLAVRDVFNEPILANFAKLLEGANLNLNPGLDPSCTAMEVFEV